MTRQSVTGTKKPQKNLYFSECSIHFLVDIYLKECHLVLHVQLKWPRKWSKHFGNISVALHISDDIIIGGKEEQEHDLILCKVLTRARERSIKFNRDKIQFRVSQVKRVGEVVSELGFSPGPEKILIFTTCPPHHAKKTCKGYRV